MGMNAEETNHEELYDMRDVERLLRGDARWPSMFLISRKHDVDKALELLDGSLRWRKRFALNGPFHSFALFLCSACPSILFYELFRYPLSLILLENAYFIFLR